MIEAEFAISKLKHDVDADAADSTTSEEINQAMQKGGQEAEKLRDAIKKGLKEAVAPLNGNYDTSEVE